MLTQIKIKTHISVICVLLNFVWYILKRDIYDMSGDEKISTQSLKENPP